MADEITQVGSFNVTPSDAYLSTNVEAATLAPSKAPDDLLGIRNTIYNELGIPQAQADYQNAYNSFLNTQTSQDSALNQLEGKTLGMNVIRGAQAETSRQFGQKLGAQSRGLKSLGMTLQAKLAEAGTQYGIRAASVQDTRKLMLQYPGAGIKFGDSTQKIASRLEKFQKAEEDKAYKKALKEQLMELGKSTRGLSKRELERKLKKANKASLAQAAQVADLELQKLRLSIQKARNGLNEESYDPSGAYSTNDDINNNTVDGANGPMSGTKPINPFSSIYR